MDIVGILMGIAVKDMAERLETVSPRPRRLGMKAIGYRRHTNSCVVDMDSGSSKGMSGGMIGA